MMDRLTRTLLVIAVEFLSFVDVLSSQPLAHNSTSNTTLLAGELQENTEKDDSAKIRAALIIGIGLSAMIVGCMAYFMFRGYLQQKRYQNHRMLHKLHENGSSGRYTPKEECQTFTEIKL